MWLNISRIGFLQKAIRNKIQDFTQDQDLMVVEGEEVDLDHLGLLVKFVEKLATLLSIVGTSSIPNSVLNN